MVTTGRLRRACHLAGLVTTARRRRFTTMLLWETLTGGDIRLHPGELAPHDPADRSEYAAFCKAEAIKLADYLAEEAERHLLRHRIDEPVTWQPQCQGIGPDGPSWLAAEADKNRRLPGWTSPSRQNTPSPQRPRPHTARTPAPRPPPHLRHEIRGGRPDVFRV
jgi:hypothetical protein